MPIDWLRAGVLRLRALLFRRSLEQDLEEELRFHQEMLLRDAEVSGLAAERARFEAHRRFGNAALAMESSREVWTLPVLEGLVSDLRHAIRALRRSPIVGLAIVLTLGLAIGANTAIFSLVNELLLSSLPVDHPANLYFIERVTSDGSHGRNLSSYSFGRLTAAPGAPVVAGYDFTRVSARLDGVAQPAEGMLVTGSFFPLLGIRPTAGRLLTPADDSLGHPLAVVISHRFWIQRFGGRAIPGEGLLVNGAPATVVGVLPPEFSGLTPGQYQGELWMPLAWHPVFRLKDHTHITPLLRIGATVDRAGLEERLTSIYHAIIADSAAAVSGSAESSVEERLHLTPAGYGAGSGLDTQLHLLMGAGVMVLLVVAANLANLLLSRAVARRRESGVRLALGASRGRLVQQHMVEGALLAGLGAGLGILMARSGTPALAAYLDASEVFAPAAAPDWKMLAFISGITLAVTAIFTLAPSLAFDRRDLHQALKAAAPGGRGSRSGVRISRVLVILQVALSLVLLVTAGLLVTSTRNLNAMDPGYQPDEVLQFQVYPTTLGITGAEEIRLYNQLQHRLETLPGVRSVTTSRYVLARTSREHCDPPAASGPPGVAGGFPVGPHFFETMGVPVLRGREFDDRDRASSARVAVLSRSAARALFPAGDPVGRLVTVAGEPEARSVIGVVGDVTNYSLATADRGMPSCNLYLPVSQAPAADLGQQWIELRTPGGAEPVLPAVREAVHEVNPDLAVFWPSTVREYARSLYQPQSSLGSLAGIFGALSVLFAAIGLFGIVSYAVTSRTGELGLRLALGARPGALALGIVLETQRLLAVGLVLGLAASAVVAGVSSSLLYGVSPLEPRVLLGGAGILAVVGLIAASLPAHRAASIDPAITLRSE